MRNPCTFILAAFLLPAIFCSTASLAAPAAAGEHAAPSTLTGQFLTHDGAPLAEGMVNLYDKALGPPPAHERYWRVPDFLQTLDKDGRFSFSLPEGEYYLGAIKRASGKPNGPPREGDLYLISSDAKGAPLTYSVKANTSTDLGRIAGVRPFRGSTVNYGKGVTAIEGVVVDDAGKPVAGSFVLAFTSAEKGRLPLFISEPTGEDGRFILRVHDAGSYFLKSRSVYGGGRPALGEVVGIFGEKGPSAVTVKKGERVTGVTIHAISFVVRGPQNKPGEPPTGKAK